MHRIVNFRTLSLFATVTAAIVLQSVTASASPFQNGSFEVPNSTGGTDFKTDGDTSITGWVVHTDQTNGFDFYQADTDNEPYTLPAFDGNHVVTLNNPGGFSSIAQTFDTTPGAAYQVTFELSRESPSTTTDLSTPEIDLAATGNLSSPYLATSGPWAGKIYDFVAAGASTTLTFTQNGGSGNSPVLDAVAVTLVTPEPASLSVVALSALTLLGRRRRA